MAGAATDDVVSARVVDSWRSAAEQYGGADVGVAVRQLVTTLVPLAGLLALSAATAPWSWWATIPPGVLAGLFLVRLFGLFHDCVHGSLLPGRRANRWVGTVLGALLLTPFQEWGRRHHLHHATSGNLDRRGWWDFPMMTVREFAAAPWTVRVPYYLVRHPAVLLGVAPMAFFLVVQRLPAPGARARHVREVLVLDALALAVGAALARADALGSFLVVFAVPTVVSTTIGFWLFYVQHQFPATSWEVGASWSWTAAAFDGSSLLHLPRWLRWFTVDLGYHHIHHLAPTIPNHRLAACHEDHPGWTQPHQLTVRSGLAATRVCLWDEERRLLVPVRTAVAAGAAAGGSR